MSKTSYTQSSPKSLKNTENFTNSTIEHIFEGQVNARGKVVGYHYEAIEKTAGKVIPKTANGGFSTFYSKDMSPQEVIHIRELLIMVCK